MTTATATKFVVTKVHSTKWIVTNPAGDVVFTAKTKGAAQAEADRLATAPAPKPVPAQKTKASKRAEGELTRKQCLEALAAAGYTGPTSYLMPRLRALVAEHTA